MGFGKSSAARKSGAVEKGGRMAGSRAADDFVVIRARLAELQRQRDEATRGVEPEPSAPPYRGPARSKSAELAEYQLKLLRGRHRFTR